MTWIEVIEEGDAKGPLKALYEALPDPETHKVDNILKVHSLHPAGLKGHVALYQAVMTGTPGLRKVDREMIALLVSQHNECSY